MRCAASMGRGTVLGRPCRAYRAEPNVAADSNVETYVAMRLAIDNWRWAGRAVLPAHRQAHVAALCPRWRSASSTRPMRRSRTPDVECAAAELAGAAHPAGRGHLAAVRGEAAGAGGGSGGGADGFPLPGLVPARAERRLRDADLRLHDRRPDAVPARRHGGGDLAGGAAGAGRLGGQAGRGLPELRRGQRGAACGGALLQRDGRAWRPVGGDRTRGTA